MKANIDRYFISANKVDDIPESYYQKLEPVLQTIEAFTRNTGKVAVRFMNTTLRLTSGLNVNFRNSTQRKRLSSQD